MNEVTQRLARIEGGDPKASEQLMPLLYDALRKLAARHMASEKPNQSLDATALVHEAYLKLVGTKHYESRGHFYMAASRAMRQILIDQVRRRKRIKHGGQLVRQNLDLNLLSSPVEDAQLLELDEALREFANVNPQSAQLVELRFFGGMSLPEIAEFLGTSLSSAERSWRYARAWLYEAIKQSSEHDADSKS